MASLLERLRNHDWFYAYSDDHRVWKKGREKEKLLQEDMKNRECPYPLGDVRMAVQSMILEDFTEREPNRWFRDPENSRYFAPAMRRDLIERERAEEILEWISLNETR